MASARKPQMQVPIGYWLLLELIAVGVLAACWTIESRLAGYSALVGGLIFVIPNAYVANRAYRFQGARQMNPAVGS